MRRRSSSVVARSMRRAPAAAPTATSPSAGSSTTAARSPTKRCSECEPPALSDALPGAVGVDVGDRLLAQLIGVLFGPLGRSEQPPLLAVPRREDDRAGRLPALLHQLAERARRLHQHDIAARRIARRRSPRRRDGCRRESTRRAPWCRRCGRARCRAAGSASRTPASGGRVPGPAPM